MSDYLRDTRLILFDETYSYHLSRGLLISIDDRAYFLSGNIADIMPNQVDDMPMNSLYYWARGKRVVPRTGDRVPLAKMVTLTRRAL